MPLLIVRNDITRMPVDAIVNSTNPVLRGSGRGVDRAIHLAAGPELQKELDTMNGCPVGSAVITRGFKLPCRYIIHCAAPAWEGGSMGEERLLRQTYRTVLKLAVEKGCETLAVPVLSSGAYAYPREEAFRIAREEISSFLSCHEDLTVSLVIFGGEMLRIGGTSFRKIEEYIDDHYVGDYHRRMESYPQESRRPRIGSAFHKKASREDSIAPPRPAAAPAPSRPKKDEDAGPAPEEIRYSYRPVFSESLPNIDGIDSFFNGKKILTLDESFSEAVLRLIRERGMTNAQCYHKANLTRSVFNKLSTTPGYKPSKTTALALAVALRLNLEETRSLLEKAGLALSHSLVGDVIVEYFIVNKEYDVMKINEALFEYDQSLLGSI